MLLLFQLIADTYQPLATFYGESSGLVAEVAEVAQNFFCLLREWWQQGGGCAAAAKGHRLIVGLLPLPHHQHQPQQPLLFVSCNAHTHLLKHPFIWTA